MDCYSLGRLSHLPVGYGYYSSQCVVRILRPAAVHLLHPHPASMSAPVQPASCVISCEAVLRIMVRGFGVALQTSRIVVLTCIIIITIHVIIIFIIVIRITRLQRHSS